MYALQRANGEWLTIEIEGTRCLPIFQNAAAARRVKTRVGALMVYLPQPLDTAALERLQQRLPGLKFWLVDDFNPSPGLTPGRWLSAEEIVAIGEDGDYALTA
ncbi:MAG: hypothetical protein CFK52_03710 [Chloracidobacterium sp. CP2_5A]|nr:MAG: hypothetical protein CFK52_03710 [Chloracidobacterium sp. CP2_5A]